MNTQQEYRVSDIYTAAWLLANGLQLVGTGRRGDRIDLVFDDRRDQAVDLVKQYNTGVPMCNVRSYGAALREVRRALYRAQDAERDGFRVGGTR